MAESLDWLISVDDHVLEPGHVWESRLPKKHRERGPRLVTDDIGEAWVYEGKRVPTVGLSAAAGRKKEEFSPLPITYAEMRPGCYDSTERLVDMNTDGVLASLCFPSFPRFCGQIFAEAEDKDLALLCVRAYNDWMIEEWAGAAPGRFIPLVIIPLWDPREAGAEVERTAAKGAKAIAFSENPSPLGLPSIHDQGGYWLPLFEAASDTKMPLCTHLGSSSQLPKPSPDSPLISTVTLSPMNIATTCVEWLFSGVLPKYPDLKVCLSEGGIGWIPYVLERADYVVERQGSWATSTFEGDLITGTATLSSSASGAEAMELPSETFRRHIYGCFIDDVYGIRALDLIGEDNVMIETDYPHTDSSWPNSRKIAHERLDGKSNETSYKVLRGNAERVFNFTPAAVPFP